MHCLCRRGVLFLMVLTSARCAPSLPPDGPPGGVAESGAGGAGGSLPGNPSAIDPRPDGSVQAGGAGGRAGGGSGGSSPTLPPDAAAGGDTRAMDAMAPITDTPAPMPDTLAPMPEAGGGSIPAPGGPALACPAGAVLCEDFEKNLVMDFDSGRGWGNHIGGSGSGTGSAVRDTTRPFSGMGALHSTVSFNDSGSAYARKTHRLAVPRPNAYFRFFVYLTAGSLPTMAQRDASMQIGLFYGVQQGMAVGAGLKQGRLRASGWSFAGGRIADTPFDTTDFPTGRWVCVEYVLQQGSGTSVSIWRDGQLVVNKAAVTLETSMDAISLGPYGANLSPIKFEGWFDDLVVSASPIGCGR